MNIIRGRPPNYAELVKCGQFRIGPRTIFTYGRNLYAPAGLPIDEALMAHETVHSGSQIAQGVETWWRRYIEERQFRFEEELWAHKAEWGAVKDWARGPRRARLREIARRLSGPLYGSMCSMHEAKVLLVGEAHARSE